MIPYTVKRSNRKTTALHVNRDGSVEVRCPHLVSEKTLARFVEDHRDWLETHAASAARNAAERERFTLTPGCSLRLLGHDYPLETVEGTSAGFDGSRFYVPVALAHEEIKSTLVGVYKSAAKRYIPPRVAALAAAMGLPPASVRITSAKTRWGSCSGKNAISFSWRLIMAPADAVEYVIVHELAHTLEHNHSRAFWALVARRLPDYREREKTLKALQKQLETENWE